MTALYGTVASTEDPMRIGRIRVTIPGRTEGISTELLPYYMPMGLKNVHDLPALGSLVEVILRNDDVYFGHWRHVTNPVTTDLSDEDYPSAKVLLYRDLSDNDDEGIIELSYRKSIGFRMSLLGTEIILRRDNSIFLKNEKTGNIIHMSDEGISFGSENKSDQPGVLGDTNVEVLDMVNDTIKDFKTELNTQIDALKLQCMGSPYTVHLAATLTQAVAKISAKVDPLTKKNHDTFPETKSKLVTLNKEK